VSDGRKKLRAGDLGIAGILAFLWGGLDKRGSYSNDEKGSSRDNPLREGWGMLTVDILEKANLI